MDYPDYAARLAQAVADGRVQQGLLVCGSGTGMAITANKVPGVRAAVAWSDETARLARQHNDATSCDRRADHTAGGLFRRSCGRGLALILKADAIPIASRR